MTDLISMENAGTINENFFFEFFSEPMDGHFGRERKEPVQKIRARVQIANRDYFCPFYASMFRLPIRL